MLKRNHSLLRDLSTSRILARNGSVGSLGHSPINIVDSEIQLSQTPGTKALQTVRLPVIESRGISEYLVTGRPTAVGKPTQSFSAYKHIDPLKTSNKPIQSSNGSFALSAKFVEARLKNLFDSKPQSPDTLDRQSEI